MLLLPVSRTRQPQDHVGLDVGNPLTRGIFFVSNGATSGYDPVNKVFPTTSGSSVTLHGVGASGKAQVFSSSGYRNYANADSLIFANGYSVLSVARSTSLSSQSGLVAKWDAAVGNTVPMTFFVRSDGALALWRNVGGTNNGTRGTTAGDIVTGRDFVASVDAGSTALNQPNFYIDGSYRSDSWKFGPNGSDVALQDGANSIFGVGASNGGSTTWQGNIYLTVCWNRRLTAEEHIALHDNPWQIFAPTRRRISQGSAVSGGALSVANEVTATFAGESRHDGALSVTNAVAFSAVGESIAEAALSSASEVTVSFDGDDATQPTDDGALDSTSTVDFLAEGASIAEASFDSSCHVDVQFGSDAPVIETASGPAPAGSRKRRYYLPNGESVYATRREVIRLLDEMAEDQEVVEKAVEVLKTKSTRAAKVVLTKVVKYDIEDLPKAVIKQVFEEVTEDMELEAHAHWYINWERDLILRALERML